MTMDFDAGQCSIVRQKRGVPRAEAAAPAIHVRGEDFCEAAGGGWGAGRGGGGGGWGAGGGLQNAQTESDRCQTAVPAQHEKIAKH